MNFEFVAIILEFFRMFNDNKIFAILLTINPFSLIQSVVDTRIYYMGSTINNITHNFTVYLTFLRQFNYTKVTPKKKHLNYEVENKFYSVLLSTTKLTYTF